jgi:hypothetical protein
MHRDFVVAFDLMQGHRLLLVRGLAVRLGAVQDIGGVARRGGGGEREGQAQQRGGGSGGGERASGARVARVNTCRCAIAAKRRMLGVEFGDIS